MKIILSNSHDPYYNLALEEALLEFKKEDDILLFYVNDNAIIFGRNQNILEEVNFDYVKEHQISLVRRISGGGAVYQDTGNINFSFITKNQDKSFQTFLKPIIEFLQSLGLEADFKGKNDLLVNGFKVSGNAQYRRNNHMFHHGTLLFDSNLKVLASALKPNELKLSSKAIKSVRQRVANISEILPKKISTDEFKEKLVKYFLDQQDNQKLKVSRKILARTNELQELRRSRSWIWEENPKFDISNIKRFAGGTIKFEASIAKNKVKNLKFSGDFLSSNDFEKVYHYFEDVDFTPAAFKMALTKINSFENYFGKITIEDLIELIFKDI